MLYATPLYVVLFSFNKNFAEKFDAKWIFGGCVLIGGLLTLLTPLSARVHIRLLIAVRFLTGIIPPSERRTVPSGAQTGGIFGIITTTSLVSIMIGEHFLGGWPSTFYVFGKNFYFDTKLTNMYLLIIRCIFLFMYGKTPWKHIIRCPPTLLTSLPTYFSIILNFNLHQSDLIFSIPYFAQFLVIVVSGPIVDRIRARNILSITILRKGQTIIGTLGTCSFLIAIGYMGCNHIGAVICCIIALGFLGLHTCGPIISHLDVASNYAGTLVGITNSLATIPGFVGPYVQTIEAWRLIFNISAGIGALGCIVYCILFNGKEQPWNRTCEARERNESIVSIDT
ncbi:unnamed protein product [Rotaria sordida]|uniref:Major facilitator superfamily (MFS) profile domain-containing protein n=1 Tax=Rotaria sordida TaxID=392033 RepID=A0A814XUB4_9BILA|nr:unnamed protein product [Rotaria sordida]